MEKMKKLLSVVLTIAMLMSMIVLPVSAENLPETIRASENKAFTLMSGETKTLAFTATVDGWYILYDANNAPFGFSVWDANGSNAGGGRWSSQDGRYDGYVFWGKEGMSYELYVNNSYDESTDFNVYMWLAEHYSGLQLDCTEFTGTFGDCLELNAITEGALAYEYITWTSSNEDVAYPEYRRNNYIAYRLLAPGTTTITATTESGLSASCQVTVAPDNTVQSIVPGESKLVDLATDEHVMFNFVPAESGDYTVSVPINTYFVRVAVGVNWALGSDIEGQWWEDEASGRAGLTFYAEAGKNHVIQIVNSKFEAFSGLQVSLTKVEDDEVETISAGETKRFDLDYKEEAYYRFTPTESGRYIFFRDNETYRLEIFKGTAADSDALLEGDFWADHDAKLYGQALDLEAGKTYLVRATNVIYQYNWSFALSVKKAEKYQSFIIDSINGGIVGEQIQFSTAYEPATASETVTWTVSDPTVATIDSSSPHGVVINLVGPGKTTVTAATASGLTDSGVIYSKLHRPMTVGETVELTLDRFEFEPLLFTPAETGRYIFYTPAEGNLYMDAIVHEENIYVEPTEWESSDGKYVGVAYSMEAGVTYAVDVKNWDHDETITTSVTLIKTQNYSSIALDKSTYANYPGNYTTLTIVGSPVGASESITWSSSNESVATIEYASDTEADIILLSVGKATITATTASGKKATCVVTVKDPVELKLNKAHTETVDVAAFVFAYFTAPTTDTYSFYAEGDGYYAYSVVDNATGQYVQNGTYWYKNGVEGVDCTMRAGQTYIFLVFNTNSVATTYQIMVGQPVKATGLSILPETVVAYTNSGFFVETIFKPVLAIGETVTWTSSNEDIVKFAQDYTEGDFTYHEFQTFGAGTATITATSASGKKATCKITVLEPETLKLGAHRTGELVPWDYVMYSFTPTTSGSYIICHNIDDPCAVGWDIDISEGITAVWEDGKYAGIEAELEGGKTYRFAVQSEAEDIRAFDFWLKEGRHEHELTLVPAQNATYVAPGNIEHYTCTCGKFFADAKAETELTEADVIIPVLEGSITLKSEEVEEVTVAEGKEVVFLFTAPADGTYSFFTDHYIGNNDKFGWHLTAETADGQTVATTEHHTDSGWWYGFDIPMTKDTTYILKASQEAVDVTCKFVIGKFAPATSMKLDQSAVTVYPYEQFVLNPDFGSIFAIAEDVTFTSSNPAIVEFNPNYEEETGLGGYGFKPLKPGKVTITATSENGLKATCTVTVKTPESIGLGEHTTPVLNDGDSITYYFTPEVSGKYDLYLTSEMDFVLQWSSLKENERELWKGPEYVGFRAYLEAGETYTVYVQNFYQQGSKTFTFWLSEAHEHAIKPVEAKAPTYTEDGYEAHYACDCGVLFADAEGTIEIEMNSIRIPMLIQISEGKAEVPKEVIDEFVAEVEQGGEVSIPVAEAGTNSKEEVKSTALPVESLTQIAEKEATLTVEMPTATVTMDAAALAAVAAQADSSATVTLEIYKGELNAAQKDAVKDLYLVTTISAQLLADGEPIASESAGGFGGGKATVKIPVKLSGDFEVLYIADDGTVTKLENVRYENGILTLELEHFSDYAIVQDALLGDVNGDGSVTVLDLMRLANFFAGKNVEILEGNSDVNGDGKVTVLDLMRLANFFAGKADLG